MMPRHADVANALVAVIIAAAAAYAITLLIGLK
jgi:hypothetical protein